LSDWRATAFFERKEKDRVPVVFETEYFRRSADRRFLILFVKPKAVAGQGYLRIDNNLWFYDPGVGRWDRRTERERINGTDARRSDIDESRFAEQYEPSEGTEQKLGVHDTICLRLNGKPGLDLAFPALRVWIDQQTKNVLKREEYALSGRLLRTTYYTKWTNVYSASKKGDVWYPAEIRMFDELERANSTVTQIRSVDLKPLDANLFTKAWLESKSR